MKFNLRQEEPELRNLSFLTGIKPIKITYTISLRI